MFARKRVRRWPCSPVMPAPASLLRPESRHDAKALGRALACCGFVIEARAIARRSAGRIWRIRLELDAFGTG